MEVIAPTIQMWLTFAVIIGAIVAYASDRIPLEITSIAVVTVLLFIFHMLPIEGPDGSHVSSRNLLAGFADPALITILALLVVGQGLVQTGALNHPARQLIRLGEKAPRTVISLSLILVALTSAVLNNTPVVVIFIPIMATLAEKLGRRVSSVMIPLSYVAILGGNLTLIGSSTNLLAAGAYQAVGQGRIGFFDFTMSGAVLAAVGFVYVLLLAPRLLVDRRDMKKRLAGSGGRQFLFQIELEPDNALVGKKAVAGMFPGLKDVTVRMIQRGRTKLLPPYDDITLEAGDIVLVAATRQVMMDLLNASPDMVSDAEGDPGEDEEDPPRKRRAIAEAVVAPASRLDGRTIAQTGFRAETGCSVLGIQRRSRMIRASIAQLRLEAGDVLLVMGERPNVMALRDNRDVLLMESSATDMPVQAYAGRALAIFAAVVGLAAANLLPIVVAALGGAALMLTTRCLNVRQAARAIDRRVLTIVGAALAMGTALQGTGGATFLAHGMVEMLSGAPVWVMLSGFFLLVAVLTNILSNNATAVLFTPISVSLAGELGLDPMPFLLAVIFGANCSFATPMSYQTNLLVMAPGHYKFSDFLRVGTPLIGLMWLTYTLFVPWAYGLL
ncbi:SLC13 family permease [Yunchengibacter salinarum]|uniref:SLC13 family permease n=1 Tax=Yunchengibacter salinarum TaxID=3133399 RepID=UPI0035B572FE